MYRYTARRLLAGLLTALLASVLIFAILRPTFAIAPERFIACLGDCEITDEQQRKLRESLGLVGPLHVQYFRWMGGWLSGNWGESFISSEAIWEKFKEGLPATLQLVSMTLAFAILIGIPAGIIMALVRSSLTDLLNLAVLKMSLALPIFWTATLLLVAGTHFLDWDLETGYISFIDDPIGNLGMFAWPALVLGIPAAGTVALMTRSTALDALRQDDVQIVAEAGTVYSLAVFLHTLRYTLVPTFVTLGLILPAIVGGALLMERVFVLDGVGDMFTEAANQRDFPIMESLALFFSVWVIAVNTAVDILCGWLDATVRSTGKSPREEWNHLANPVRLV